MNDDLRPATMRAAVQRAYGPPEVVDVLERPLPPVGARELLVRVRAATVSSGDARLRRFDLPGIFWVPGRLVIGITRPRRPVLGYDMAGEVVAVGAEVTRFAVGERIFGMHDFGGHAEYRAVPEGAALALIPEGAGFEDAAAMPFGASTALDFWRRGGLAAGQRVLVIGGSGAVGSMAVQLARHAGARVDAVSSGANAELVRELGAEVVLDHTRPDHRLPEGVYDLVFDTQGVLTAADAFRVLKPQGRLLSALPDLALMLAQLRYRGRIVGGEAVPDAADMAEIARLMAAGVLRPVIDSTYPLADIRSAHRRVDSGRKRGAVVVVTM